MDRAYTWTFDFLGKLHTNLSRQLNISFSKIITSQPNIKKCPIFRLKWIYFVNSTEYLNDNFHERTPIGVNIDTHCIYCKEPLKEIDWELAASSIKCMCFKFELIQRYQNMG